MVSGQLALKPVLSLGFYHSSAPGIEAFPTSLSSIELAGLDQQLDQATKAKLRQLEDELRERVQLAPVLRARTKTSLNQAVEKAFKATAGYYMESAIIIWRALGHDYEKLTQLAERSSAELESFFFRKGELLKREDLVNALAGLRVLSKVGLRTILKERGQSPEARVPPLDYLNLVMGATFITACLLAYLKGEVPKARRGNLRELAQTLLGLSGEAYQQAVQTGLFDIPPPETVWFWSPDWQVGEVEAELDRRKGEVARFASAEELLADLRN